MNAITISHLTKRYGKLKAVDNVSLAIPRGEFFAFLGPNGAGKTTLINCMTGLSTFAKGTIKIFGNDVVKEYKEARVKIGLSAQELVFDPYFSILDVLVYQAGYYGIPKKKALPKAKKLLKQFGLWEKRNVVFRSLSGGMKRRLSLAKALIHDPELIILDEPTAGLDVELRKELWSFIQKVNKQGTTIFLTTHYIEEAEQLAERIGIIHKGNIIQVDKTRKIMEDLGVRELRVKTKEDFEDFPDRLAKILKQKNGYYAFSFRNTDNKTEDIMNFFEKKKATILDIQTRRESLEAIFLKLTKK